MKKTIYAVATVALVAFGMTACGGSTEEQTDEAAAVTYTLDAEASTLKWEGVYEADGHKHNGTIAVSEGSLSYEGDEFKSGEFTVDMNTIVDEDLPSPDKDTLQKHLSGPYFFDAVKFPATKVTVNSLNDKEASLTINVVGKNIETTVPVKFKKTADKVTAKGKFSLDVSSLKLGGMQPMDPKMPKMFVKPVLNFDLNLTLNAEKE